MQTVVIDSDAIIALFYDKDANTEKALKTLDCLNKNEVQLICTATTIVEVVTTFQRKLSNPVLVKKFTQLVKNGDLIIEPVNQNIILAALDIFNPDKSKHNTLFDAVVIIVAKKYRADAIFSFDKWYIKVGFKLATELIKEN